eukprot:6024574-Pleurochrysis_carterae.AAC.1
MTNSIIKAYSHRYAPEIAGCGPIVGTIAYHQHHLCKHVEACCRQTLRTSCKRVNIHEPAGLHLWICLSHTPNRQNACNMKLRQPQCAAKRRSVDHRRRKGARQRGTPPESS